MTRDVNGQREGRFSPAWGHWDRHLSQPEGAKEELPSQLRPGGWVGVRQAKGGQREGQWEQKI